MNHLTHILVTIITMIACQSSFSRPYLGEKMSLKQPDGTHVMVKIFGNEFYQDVESLDGYTLIRDELTDEICYAMLSKDGKEYASTGIIYSNGETPDAVKSIIKKGIRISSESIKAKQEETRKSLNYGKCPEVSLRAARSLPDTVYGIVVLIDFPDTKSSINRNQVLDFCNGDNYKEFGNYQSIKEYFQWISNGKLTYLNYVTDFHTAPQNKSYYDSGDDYKDELFMPVVENVLNAEEYVKLSQLTAMEGRLLAINIFYAGTADAGWSHGLWPHMGWFNLRLNGFGKYTWHTFQMSDLGDKLTIGTFIHENGHLVCDWPDFYSYDGHEDNNDKYNLGSGDQTYNPGYPSPWCLDQVGWLNNKIDITNISDGRIIALQQKVGEAAVFYGTKNNAAPSEKYYLEVRKSTNEHKEPYNGIFIWHNNEEGDNTTEGKPEQQDCRPANTYDPCFKKGNNTEFNDNTAPSGIWHNGNPSGIDIWDFSTAGSAMTFRCGRQIENPEIQTNTLSNAIYDIEYRDSVVGIGGSYIYIYTITDGALPDGLTLNEDGIIYGKTKEEGTFNFSVTITDSEGKTSSKVLSIAVVNSYPYTDYINIPGTLEFEDFDIGGEGIAYHDSGEGNEGNSIRKNENVDIYTNDIGGHGIGWTTSGEWLQYSIDVKESDTYNAVIYHASYDKNIIATLYLDNKALVPSITFPASGSWGTDSEHLIETKLENITLSEGKHKLRIVLDPCTGIDLDKMVFSQIDKTEISETKDSPLQLIKTSDGFTLNTPYVEAFVSVYKSDGSLVENFKTTGSSVSFGSNYPNSLYLIRITTNRECNVFKIMK